MKKIVITIMLAGAFLGAGCSPSDESTAAATPSPVPELTAEQRAAIEKENKAAMDQKLEANRLPADASPSATPAP